MGQYWFKPFKFGWGAYPVSWQGWIVILFLVSFCVGLFVELPVIFRSKDFGVLLLFVFTAYFFKSTLIDKVDGGLKWRWGKESD